MNTKVQDVSKFRKLSEIEHVIMRPGRYLGSINNDTKNTWVIKDGKVQEQKIQINPAFLKMFDEIISNSADHAKRSEGAHMTKIEVTVITMTGTISVLDDGGIPVVIHPEEKQWIPEMIFGELRSGSNFDDDAGNEGAGQNGEGSSLVNIFSTQFSVQTADGKNSFDMIWRDNMSNKGAPTVRPSNLHYTKIDYEPDLKRLGMQAIDPDAMLMLERRCWEIAATNPRLKVYFNGKHLSIKSFEDFVKLHADSDLVYQEDDKWKVGFAYSDDGFKHITYVNSVNVYEGGTHIDYVMDKVVEAIREQIEKKTKQKLRPSDIKSQFKLIMSATINNPRFSSQTKENLINLPSAYGTKFDLKEDTVKAIMSGPIMKRIIQWAERRKVAEDLKNAQEEADKIKRKTFYHIEKYTPATEADRSKCILFLAEGDSAAKPLVAAKSRNHGVFPLRGKPINAFDLLLSDTIKKNKEFANILNILGFNLDGSISENGLRYGSLAVATDADLDGAHIRGLLIIMFRKFWPKLIESGFIKFLKTPVVVATRGKDKFEFFTEPEYDTWAAAETKPHTKKYMKGLGSWDVESMKRFMTDPKYLYTIAPMDQTDHEALNMAFDPSKPEGRKAWLALH